MARTPDEWREIVRALRAKADDKVTPGPEATALRAKATELEAKYCKSTSPITDDTTITSRDGHWTTYDDFMSKYYMTDNFFSYYMSSPQTTEYNTQPRRPSGTSTTEDTWDAILRDLLRNQYQWNSKYYDKDGKPKPGYGGEEDIVEDAYQEAPDEDTGYDIKEGDDW